MIRRYYSYIIVALASLLVLASCSEEENVDLYDGYGYLQLSLKKEITRSATMLEHLGDAKKIKLQLVQQRTGQEQTLTVDLYAPNAEAAEYGLTSENIKLQGGDYLLRGFALYGDYKSGDMAEVLQVCDLSAEGASPIPVTIVPGQLTSQTIMIQAVNYGKHSVHLVRINPDPDDIRKAAPKYNSTLLFDFTDADSVVLFMKRKVGDVEFLESRKVKAHRAQTDVPAFDTDSLDLQTGNYLLTSFTIYNKRRQYIYSQEVEIPFVVSHFELTSTEVGVIQPVDDNIRDGIALRQIWETMDGEHWSWHELDGHGGDNWIFTLADGSPRPMSAWTNQLGVTVVNGRVVSLNLGSFNPKGDVPAAIGQLTALEKLYLGMHTDEVYYQLEGVGDVHYALNPYLLGKMQNASAHRMDIARERTMIRRMQQKDFSNRTSKLLYKGETDVQAKLGGMTFAQDISTYGQNTSDAANRITGIDEAIGELTNLQELYVANTLIKKLPLSLQKLENLTDLEFYNNPFEEVDGEIFKGMKHLTSVNFDSFYRMNETQIQEMLDRMCSYCPRIQLLYMNRMNLTHLPERLNLLTDLRLLDVSFNKITSVKSLLPMAPIQVMMNYNLLEEIPADFFNNADLELFSCTDNKLVEFPAVLSNLDGPYTISEIDLTGNQMHGFQEGWHGIRVEKLMMGFNNMGRDKTSRMRGPFPMEFSQTNSVINYLVLSGNNIDYIPNSAVDHIHNLQSLDISVNNISEIPDYFNTVHMPYLTGLSLNANILKEFPNNVLNVRTLNQLLIADQGYYSDAEETRWVRTMTQWPDYLHLHPALSNLDMSGNDFRNVVNFPTNLVTLNVRNNPNIRMRVPQSIIYMMQQGLFVLYYDEGQDIEAE